LADARYGEVVGVFLKAVGGAGLGRPSDDEIRAWVSGKMGRIKAPKHVFWVGDAGVGEELPKTGSGKYQKHLIRALGNTLIKRAAGSVAAKL
jgi:mevalonyl-CoA ligase